jgi:hypothetical protein
MSTEHVNEEALQDACTEFKEGRRSSRWTYKSRDGKLEVGVSPERVIVRIYAASKELATAWENACKALAKDGTFSGFSRFEGEYRFSFEPK